jgi:IS5 family transposase
MGGQIVDASIVPVPRQRNTREENERIKAGEAPEDWDGKPHKKWQKDVDARWTKKHGKTHYGYKNHVNIDRRDKFVRDYEVTDASVHDSQALDDLIDAGNTSSQLWGDSAYRSAETERSLGEKGYRSHIHHKGNRGKPLNERQRKANKTRSKIRVRVEHVFGFQERSMGGKLIRTIGMARAKAKIGMMNLVYNMSRLVQFERGAAAPG